LLGSLSSLDLLSVFPFPCSVRPTAFCGPPSTQTQPSPLSPGSPSSLLNQEPFLRTGASHFTRLCGSDGKLIKSFMPGGGFPPFIAIVFEGRIDISLYPQKVRKLVLIGTQYFFSRDVCLGAGPTLKPTSSILSSIPWFCPNSPPHHCRSSFNNRLLFFETGVNGSSPG